MLIEERYNLITNVLKARKTITLDELSRILKVSKDTVRRDLIELEKRAVLKRTFGGAMLLNKSVPSLKHEERLSYLHDAKNLIAEATVKLIKDNSTILFDASTTVQAVVPYIKGKKIRAITNSLPTAQALSMITDCKISLLPGTLHKEHLYVTGSDTIEKISNYHVDACLLGSSALDYYGIYTHTEEEGLVKKQILRQSSQKILLVDHTKFETIDFYKVGELNCIDILITDTLPSESIQTSIKNSGVRLITNQTA